MVISQAPHVKHVSPHVNCIISPCKQGLDGECLISPCKQGLHGECLISPCKCALAGDPTIPPCKRGASPGDAAREKKQKRNNSFADSNFTRAESALSVILSMSLLTGVCFGIGFTPLPPRPGLWIWNVVSQWAASSVSDDGLPSIKRFLTLYKPS